MSHGEQSQENRQPSLKESLEKVSAEVERAQLEVADLKRELGSDRLAQAVNGYLGRLQGELATAKPGLGGNVYVDLNYQRSGPDSRPEELAQRQIDYLLATEGPDSEEADAIRTRVMTGIAGCRVARNHFLGLLSRAELKLTDDDLAAEVIPEEYKSRQDENGPVTMLSLPTKIERVEVWMTLVDGKVRRQQLVMLRPDPVPSPGQ